MVDYSKWDHIGSDEDSSDEDSPRFPEGAEVPSELVNMASEVLNPRGGDTPSIENCYVTLHPQDTGAGLRRCFLTDPRTFVPVLDERTQTATMWGLPEEDEGGGIPASMMRRMTTQSIYFREKSPEQQFVEVLKDRKRAALAARRDEAAQGLDLIVRVALAEFGRHRSFEELDPSVWRRVRLSGATNLQTLHDRVLGPAMGWTRNYHGFFFTDFSDGALWCPIDESSAIDMMHVPHHIIAALRPADTTLGELLRAPGDRLGYTYDIGDFFEHVLTLEAVVPAAESTGAVQVLGGAMRCPNEDGDGNWNYQEKVLDHFNECGGVYDRNPPLRFAVGQRVECNMGPAPGEEPSPFFRPTDVFAAGTVTHTHYRDPASGRHFLYNVRLDAVRADGNDGAFAMNDVDCSIRALGEVPAESEALAAHRRLHEACLERRDAMNCRPPEGSGIFDPGEFDLEACRARVRAAIGSRASAQEGSKIFMHGLGGGPEAPPSWMGTGPGRAPSARPDGLTETISTRPDQREERVCGACGSPKPPLGLKACAKCKTLFYCSRECQSAHWPTHRPDCKRFAAERAAYKRDKKAVARIPP